MQFLFTGSGFLHIMIIYNFCFCKILLCFMSLTYFFLNPILLLMIKMTRKQFIFHLWITVTVTRLFEYLLHTYTIKKELKMYNTKVKYTQWIVLFRKNVVSYLLAIRFVCTHRRSYEMTPFEEEQSIIVLSCSSQ